MIARYMRWLHTGWPAGTVEKLPDVREGGLTNVPGVRVVGDLTGIPLLKFSADTGARAVQAILAEPDFAGARGQAGVHDLVIIGAGVSGCAAAVEALQGRPGLRALRGRSHLLDGEELPQGKPIYTYPTEMVPAGTSGSTTR
ncbi:MAG: hypothetical protein R3F43_21180 [bacterium]